MEHSLPSLTFKGSIPEAIIEAKKQKKLFVVYISGENAESSQLEKSIWTNRNVAESITKYCLLVHIFEGSTDAAHFSAIYPQTSIPCITAIGYNGVQLWQNGGYISAEVLASSLEKAWLSLHIQETTASVLSAAIASRKSEPSTSVASDIGSSNQESSSGTYVPSPSVDIHVSTQEASREEVKTENKGGDFPVEERNSTECDKIPSESFDGSKPDNIGNKKASSSRAAEGLLDPIAVGMENSKAVNTSLAECSAPAEITENCSGPTGGTKSSVSEANKAVENEKTDAADKHVGANKSSDVHFNIRLPNGGSLQAKLSATSTLRMVKDYVDKNQASGIGRYDLAIPYPRKVFSDQDLSKSLLELGLFDRQALILVPHQKSDYSRGHSSSEKANSTTMDESSDGNNGGYFAYVKRILSYMNPFSYLGGAANISNSGHGYQNGMREYGPNSAVRSNLTEAERRSSPYEPNRNNPTSRNNEKSRQATSSRYGSNIHTLKHDEDDSRFSDRNSFWNGNSTQYGGDNDDK
ncbi:plant UBX domain-containing protein 11 [Quillaja saponaria]|uniref:Plant UBX domain-containing protein 11 n=1 Tax=Quillaja saponaria TaxID=32244 RepID=A0AAD7QCV8_QUISA|nr:plant UBX domain-containing protein 11 [Quillaja saponaria]